MKPKKRTDDLVVQDIDGEILVYDLRRHVAHSLDALIARVWDACDGETEVAALAGDVGDTDAAEHMVALLAEKDLLEPQTAHSPATRRNLLKRARTIAALAAITTISSPLPAAAGSCKASGQPCATGAECCSTICSTMTFECT